MIEKQLAQQLVIPGGNGTDANVLINGPVSWLYGINNETISNLLNHFIPYILAAAGFGLLLMMISGGFQFLTSAGDPKKSEAGKQQITNAIIGFIIIFVAFWIVQILGYITGFTEIQNIFK